MRAAILERKLRAARLGEAATADMTASAPAGSAL
jgi:hypothetical protein